MTSRKRYVERRRLEAADKLETDMRCGFLRDAVLRLRFWG
jgi:hypothetical protein